VRSEDVGGLPCLTVSGPAGETVRLVDTVALFALHPESGLNREQPGAADDGARRNQDTYVVVAADGKLALPIDAFEEVLQVPAADCAAAAGGAAMTFNWRGSAIAVRDLRPPHAAGDATVVLVVLRTAGAPVALAVEQVVAMITPGSAELTRMQRGGDMVELLIVAEEAGHATYRVADPAALLAAGTA
jgi:chemotaxis signal transduction protein